MMNEEFFTVSQLNTLIRDVLLSGFPQPVWVCGEIQGYERQKTKNHIFFQMIEKDPRSHLQKAVIDLVIWAGKKDHIREILSSAQESFELKDDIEVKFLCRVDFYPPHGRVRLSVETIDPYFTLGKLAQQKQQLIAKLKEEGVLEKNKQLELSPVLLNIGLITSDDSAAYNDFVSELTKSRFGFKVYLRNCLMQGKKAEKDVVAALQELSAISSLDAIVITRGGGSLAELSCFDSELIAKKIAAYPLPVLSGIGHEINTTITDLASHTHAKTPTAIAQYLVQRVANFLQALHEKGEIIFEEAIEKIEGEKTRLRSEAMSLQVKTNQYFKDHNVYLVRLLEMIKARPLEAMRTEGQNIDRLSETLKKSIKIRLHQERQRTQALAKVIDMADPVNTLKRGFSITRREDGTILKSITDVEQDDMILTQLGKGVLESKVRRIIKEE